MTEIRSRDKDCGRKEIIVLFIEQVSILTQQGATAMKRMPWKEQYSVGVKEIDRQHRRLLDIINQINDSFEKKDKWQSTSAIIDSLIHYAYNHFATEEWYMIEAEYPELSWHIGLHLTFIRKVSLMSEKYNQKGLAM